MTGLRRAFFGAMGTRVEVSVPREADRDAEVVVQELFAAREAALSRFRPGSDLCRLNAAAGRAVAVGPVLLDAVERALRAARATGGAFDPALGSHMRALGYDAPSPRSRGTTPRPRRQPLGPAGSGGASRSIASGRR